MLATALVELRIRGLREFQCKREWQILEIHCHSVVIDQAALQDTHILRSLKLDGIGQETRELILDHRIGSQLDGNLGCSGNDVIVLSRGLHCDLVVDLQELVVRSRDIGDRGGCHGRCRSHISRTRGCSTEPQQLPQTKVLGTRRPTHVDRNACLLIGTSLKDQCKRSIIGRVCDCKLTQIRILGNCPSLSSTRRIQRSLKGGLQSRKVLVAVTQRDQLIRTRNLDDEAIGTELCRNESRRVGHFNTDHPHTDDVANWRGQTIQEVGRAVRTCRCLIRQTNRGIHVDILAKAGVHVNQATLDVDILVHTQLGFVNLPRHPLLCDLSFFPLDLRVCHETLMGQLKIQDASKERRCPSVQHNRSLLSILGQCLQQANKQQRTSTIILLAVVRTNPAGSPIRPSTDTFAILFLVSRTRHTNLPDKLRGLRKIHQSNLGIVPLVKRLFQDIHIHFFDGFPQICLVFILEIP